MPVHSEEFSTDDYVVVSLPTINTKQQKYYVGQIVSVGNEFEIKFMRNKNFKFIWPIADDISLVSKDAIICKLNKPSETKRGLLFKDIDNLQLKLE